MTLDHESVTLNAWEGAEPSPVSGSLYDTLLWSLRTMHPAAPMFLAPEKVDLRDWRDPRVGWGIVLAERATIPPAIERLRVHRNGAPVFRFRPASKYAYAVLRNNDAMKDVDINASPRGTASGALPYYLLICGSPAEVPWRLQYALNTNHCVGRLDLDDLGLERYVDALIDRWETPDATRGGVRAGEAVLWSVAHGGSDITELMRDSISAPLHSKLTSDPDVGERAVFLTDDDASAGRLAQALGDRKPALVVTTSHGQTGPPDDLPLMAKRLGMLVDQQYTTFDGSLPKGHFHPEGAIWYSHACCSAGSDAESSFVELFGPDTGAGRVLRSVSALGSLTAPLPRSLLGAEQPIRAFVGHVEPTFDWTLRQPFNRQHLTAPLLHGLYDQLYSDDVPTPVGYCLREWFGVTGGLLLRLEEARAAFNRGANNSDLLLWSNLAARDIVSTVVLGDPAVTLPAA